ncbi:MAG: replication-associated recombination protein A, partial [Pseudomonadota bacterium]
MSDLFGTPEGTDASLPTRPLADRLRPARLEEVMGQDHVLGPEAPLGAMLRAGRLTS